MDTLSVDSIWKALQDVKDPEIPVVSIVEMGIVRTIAIEDSQAIITITPTFAGCPALDTIQSDIRLQVESLGFEQVEIKTTLSPPWTTDWITAEAREKLKGFGLAPPPLHGGDFELVLMDVVICPYCESSNTVMKNSFGPTACRTIHYCNGCQQPFEQFKPL